MVLWVFHSEHSQTAGQESAASDAELLVGRLTSVNSAHVITCMLDGELRAGTVAVKVSAPPQPTRLLFLHLMVLLMSTQTKQKMYINFQAQAVRQGCSCYFWFFFGVFLVHNPQVEELRWSVVLRSPCRRAGRQAGRAPGVCVRWWRWRCCRTDSCTSVVGFGGGLQLEGRVDSCGTLVLDSTTVSLSPVYPLERLYILFYTINSWKTVYLNLSTVLKYFSVISLPLCYFRSKQAIVLFTP